MTVTEQTYAGAVELEPTTSEPGTADTTRALAETYAGGSDMADDTPDDRAKPVPRRVRFEVLRRDGHTCRYCGASAPDVELTVDHVVPRSLGGDNDPSNLVAACRDCNYGKASIAPDQATVEGVAEDAERWAAALEQAAEIRRAESNANNDREFLTAFYHQWHSRLELDWDLAVESWEVSVLMFRDHGLSIADMDGMLEIVGRNLANLRGPFRYFCGMAWSEIRERRELAAQLMEDADGAD